MAITELSSDVMTVMKAIRSCRQALNINLDVVDRVLRKDTGLNEEQFGMLFSVLTELRIVDDAVDALMHDCGLKIS